VQVKFDSAHSPETTAITATSHTRLCQQSPKATTALTRQNYPTANLLLCITQQQTNIPGQAGTRYRWFQLIYNFFPASLISLRSGTSAAARHGLRFTNHCLAGFRSGSPSNFVPRFLFSHASTSDFCLATSANLLQRTIIRLRTEKKCQFFVSHKKKNLPPL